MISALYAKTLFNHLYTHIDGYHLAGRAQGKLDGSSECLLYGEVPFDTWQKIVGRISPKKDAVFFDLGSGVGKVVLQSHLLFDFKKSIGVELLPDLHDKAIEVQKTFEKIIKPQIKNSLENRELVFQKGNILDVDLREADFILIPHPFKKEEDFMQLEENFLQQLKPKTKIVSLIRNLRSQAFKELGFENYEFSWGKSTANFYEI